MDDVETVPAATSRRQFIRWAGASSLALPLYMTGCTSLLSSPESEPFSFADAQNVFDLEAAARRALSGETYAYLSGGADDMRTVTANHEAFEHVQIRARSLVDVSNIDTTLTLFGQSLRSPILLAPVGFQSVFHPEGELATARAAAARGHQMILSSVSTFAVGDVARSGGQPLWFQLYPTTNRAVTRGVLGRAEAAGCPVVLLTVDTPVTGNREGHITSLNRLLREAPLGNFEGLRTNETVTDPTMTWDMIGWLRSNTSMKVVLKGIVTREDALLAVEHGVDGIVVSNHGGRQLESDRSTLACLPEVVAAVGGRMPVLIDGGIRRGTDIFKALALGADAIAIGRPYCWGLDGNGQRGVERALELLQAELVRAMQLAGTPRLSNIERAFVT